MRDSIELLRYFRKNLPALIVVLVVAALTLLYALGLRPGPGLTFVRTGTLVLEGVPAGAAVYADESRRVGAAGGDVRMALVPGNHQIIVDMPGGYPWNDVVTVEAGTETRVRAINVPKELSMRPLEKAERATVPSLARSYVMPSEEEPLLLKNGCVSLMVRGKQLLAEGIESAACTPPPYLCHDGVCETTVVFSTDGTIHSLIPLPGNDEALVISYGNTTAVIELDPREPRFFAPLYSGASIVLPWKDASFLLVHGAEAYEVTLP